MQDMEAESKALQGQIRSLIIKSQEETTIFKKQVKEVEEDREKTKQSLVKEYTAQINTLKSKVTELETEKVNMEEKLIGLEIAKEKSDSLLQTHASSLLESAC